MSWSARLQECRDRGERYFRQQVLDDGDALFWRHSPSHDTRTDPGHLLYGSWAGIMGLALLGSPMLADDAARDRMAAGLNRFQRPDGLFRLTPLPPDAMAGHDEEYFSFHCTNYVLGAFDAISRNPLRRLAFVEPLMEPEPLAAWLEARDWSRPWQEGNTVVNVASFFEFLARRGRAQAGERLNQIAAWLEAHQNPKTGFWHLEGVGYLQAMAGAAHLLHVFHALGRPVPRAEQIVDSVLAQGYPGIRAACADIDVVDILGHLHPHGHRAAAIGEILRRYLAELVQIQNPDGGYGDSYVTPQVTYGLTTPRKVSVTWTTWFRLATIGMIATTLVPGERGRWHFRGTLGSGFFAPPPAEAPRAASPAAEAPSFLDERRLALVRTARFLRQHATWRARQWMRSVSG
jgi:hypothetical protein